MKWHQLAWIDLEATAAIDTTVGLTPMYDAALDARQAAALAAKGVAWNVIPTGDVGVGAASPNLSHKGDKIVYTTTDLAPDGHPDALAKVADLKIVDYNNRLGGTAVPIPGASDPAFSAMPPSFATPSSVIVRSTLSAP